MFNAVSYDYDKKTKLYHFRVTLGHRFYRTVTKVGYPLSSHKYIFINARPTEFTIHRFYIPDLLAILSQIEEVGSAYDVNMKAINNLVEIINNNIIKTSEVSINLDMNEIPKFFKYEPLPVQLPAYEAYKNIRSINGSRGMILDGAVGVGKTYISLSLAKALHSEVTLIVAPLPTINKVWVESLSGDSMLYKQKQSYCLVNKDAVYNGEDYVLSSYENIKYILPIYIKNNINITTLIVDEVHNFNDTKSNRTAELMDVVTKIPFIHTIPMSGTPIKASPRDLAPLFRIINSDFDNKLEHSFLKVYGHRGYLKTEVLRERYTNHTVVLKKSGIKIPPLTTPTVKIKITRGGEYTLKTISKNLRDYIIKRSKELKSKLPEYTDIYNRLYNQAKSKLLKDGVVKKIAFEKYEHTIKVIIAHYKENALQAVSDEIKEANSFEKQYIEPALVGDDRKSFRDVKTIYKYLSLKVQGEALANIVMRARIDCYSNIASSFNIRSVVDSTVKKTLIFSNYTEVCEAAYTKSVSQKLEPVTVYGDTSKHLTRNVGIFINNKNSNPLITTYKSLSTGVPLIIANVIIIFGLPFRQYVFEQAVGRVWRTGQDKPTKAYIIELDTGDEPNITNRDFDIIDFFRKEVANITGKDDSVIIGNSNPTELPTGIHDLYVSPWYSQSSKLLKTTTDILDRWF